MSTQTHFAILGRQPELGRIELESILGRGVLTPFGRHTLASVPLPMIDRLGGSIKTGRIIGRLAQTKLDKLTIAIDLLPRPEGKLTFGVSAYGLKLVPRELEAFGLTLKKRLKEAGSTRLIAPKTGSSELSAAQFKYNGLPTAGFELILLAADGEIVIGLTEQVQDVDAYTARDYDRPARSAKVGMLPPKLAQILVNTTHAETVYDPFCGTGVILQEALLMGKAAYGSDHAPEMVAASNENLTWLGETHTLPAWGVTEADAVSVVLPDGPVAIVSEGYLGPNLTQAPSDDKLATIKGELLSLYDATLTNLATQLTSGNELALCAPAWKIGKRWEVLDIVDEASTLGYTVKVFESQTGPTPVYGRDDQIVGRALILLVKK